MEKLKKLQCTFRSICDTIKNIKANLDFYKALMDKPQGKAAAASVKRQLVYLLRKIRPGKVKGDLVFGTGDPAATGEALGIIAILYGFYPQDLHIVPDFEEKRIEGELCLKGKLRLIHVLLIAVRLFADRNVRYIMKRLTARENGSCDQNPRRM